MSVHRQSQSFIEPLEARIAPAGIYPTIIDAEKNPASHFKSTSVGTPILLKAGDLLTTGAGAQSGSYLMFVEKGQCLVFTTDLNNNNVIDFNEITGISAGDGLRLLSFVDIHGDIVTNLRANGTLSDSDNDVSNDDLSLRGDGRVLLNSTIEKIEMRGLRTTDISDQNGDTVVDVNDVGLRIVLSTYSVFGQIIAGAGFGVKSDPTSGYIVDDSAAVLQSQFFIGPVAGAPYGPDYYSASVTPLKASLGGIVVGSAASNVYFSFGFTQNTANDPFGSGDVNGQKLLANGNDVQGYLRPFTPASGVKGAGIYYVHGATATVTFNVGSFIAGDGGSNAAGGNIENVTLNGDDAGGYTVIAGNGGGGTNGNAGGSILNFQDLGSNTSAVIVKGGNGGAGTTGGGGAGGTVGFGTINLLGSVLVEGGGGGNGFTSGGAGASLAKATFSSPSVLDDYARNIVATTHDTPHDPTTGKRILTTGTVGQGGGVDFDGDGFGDIVFTSSNPSQLVVQFGDGNGGFRVNPATGFLDRIYLNGPLDAEAITIGDYNGDGHMDIAVGSSRAGDQAGITVFLSKYEDGNRDGLLTKSEDANGNGKNDLVGFEAPRYSALPSLTDAANSTFGAARSGHTISDIEAGDWNGDGFTDLAITATYYEPITLAPFQFLIFFYSDIEDGKPTGQFLANFGTKAQAVPPQSANPFLPFSIISARNNTTANIEATALSENSTHDVIVALPDTGTLSRSLQVWDNSVPAFFGPTLQGLIPLGQVDTIRSTINDPVTVYASLVTITGHDFAILDFDNDGVADFSVLSEAPAGYLVTLQGDGLGGATRIDGRYPVKDQNQFFPAYEPADNLGFFFGPPGVANHGGLDLTTSLLAIVATDADGDGLRDEVAVMINTNTSTRVIEVEIGFPPVPSTVPFNPANPNAPTYGPVPQPLPIVGVDHNPGGALYLDIPYTTHSDSSIVAFDAFYPFAGPGGVPDSRIVNYAIGDPETVFVDNYILGNGDFGFASMLNAEHYYRFVAGDGGAGLIGKGGTGGNIGSSPLNAKTLMGSVDIRVDRGDIQFVAGDGGTGFSAGGKGGSIIGAVVAPSGSVNNNSIASAQLFAGNGGTAVSGKGGDGGDIIGSSTFRNVSLIDTVWTSGNGGTGVSGGNGGDILGNQVKGAHDIQDLDLFVTAGNGGNGVKRGGNGGQILNLHASLNLTSIVEGGTMIYLGGNGGSAVSGPGGNGGGVINTSPIVEDPNQLAGDIYLAGGKGGDGRTGGNGGIVDTFVNSTDQFQVPGIVTFLGGDGGRGSKGAGGKGGDVKNIFTASNGAHNPFSLPATAFDFSRAIAGRGGDSSGNNGGNGGNVANIDITAKDNPLAVVAGAGGDGLFRGGKGGNVNGASVQIGNSGFAKALVVAGNGGDATAYIANSSDPAALQTAIKAFGGRVGHGGDGGSINGVRQVGGVSSRIDLIAGNGGDTVNYGTVIDLSSSVGRGGSVSNVVADGNIGNVVSSQVPIKSYNDIRNGETMDEFVQKKLRDESSPGSIDDSKGNVGLVVGAAGRIKSVFNGYNGANQPIFPSSPAVGGINGSILNVQARNIMAAVAGSVERIAAIQSVKGVKLTGGGAIGADKDTFNDPDNERRFLTIDGIATEAPVLDGILVDGAMVTRSLPVDLNNKFVNLGNDVYVLA
jgi:hypothetical protein